jgi:hypothetical protein
MSAASRIGLLLAGSWLLLAQAAVAGETRNVLVLYSYSRLLPANVDVDMGMREMIEHSANRPVNLHTEFLDAPYAGGIYDETVARYLSGEVLLTAA